LLVCGLSRCSPKLAKARSPERDDPEKYPSVPYLQVLYRTRLLQDKCRTLLIRTYPKTSFISKSEHVK
jgi:hypothetical protein